VTGVTFVDTSVLCELLQVPGKSSPQGGAAAQDEMERRAGTGERFVIPVTAVIETGNHIAQCAGNRYEVAGRLVRFLRAAVERRAPWLILETHLGAGFLTSLCDGDSTGEPLEALAAAKVGAGDVALLVERDQLLSASAFRTARVWTLDAGLAAHAEGPR
jgi:hypothetical protein